MVPGPSQDRALLKSMLTIFWHTGGCAGAQSVVLDITQAHAEHRAPELGLLVACPPPVPSSVPLPPPRDFLSLASSRASASGL